MTRFPVAVTLVAALLLGVGPHAARAQAADAPAAVPDEIDLRPVWKVGQSSTYRVTQTQTKSSTAEVVKAPPNLKPEVAERTGSLELEATATWTVTDASPDGGGKAAMTLDTLKMSTTNAEGETSTITADQAPEGAESARDWIRAMTGKPMTVTVDSTGHVTKVDGWQAIRDAAGENGDNLDEAYFKEIAMDMALLVGGAQGASIGDTWTHTHVSDHEAGALTYENTYELKSIAPIAGIPIALVDRRSTLSLEPDFSELPPGAPRPDLELTEASATAQLMFDTTRRELVGVNSDQVLTIVMQMEAAQGQLVLEITQRETTNSQILRTGEK